VLAAVAPTGTEKLTSTIIGEVRVETPSTPETPMSLENLKEVFEVPLKFPEAFE